MLNIATNDLNNKTKTASQSNPVQSVSEASNHDESSLLEDIDTSIPDLPEDDDEYGGETVAIPVDGEDTQNNDANTEQVPAPNANVVDTKPKNSFSNIGYSQSQLIPAGGEDKQWNTPTKASAANLLAEYSAIKESIARISSTNPVVEQYTLPHVGDTIEQYRVEELIGKGGFGAVYRVKNLKIGREEAFKLILPNATSTIEDVDKRFIREIDIVSRLEHPNIVRLYNADTFPNGVLWMTMEFVSGIRLDRYLKQKGTLSFEEAKTIISQILFGLLEAHKQDILHRDVKPANIIVSQKAGYGILAKVLDFGLAKALGNDEDAEIQKITQASSKMTFGSPNYMSPEQIVKKALAPSSDIYSVGLVFIELLTGKMVVDGKKPLEVATRQLSSKPFDLPEEWAGTAFEIVIRKAIAKPVNERYQSASEFLDALAHIHDISDPPSVLDVPLEAPICDQNMTAYSQTCVVQDEQANMPKPSVSIQSVIQTSQFQMPVVESPYTQFDAPKSYKTQFIIAAVIAVLGWAAFILRFIH